MYRVALLAWLAAAATAGTASAQSPLPAADQPKREPVTLNQRPPEFADVTEWLNSDKPLTLAGLKGKVVLVHFFAFGCHNCVNNYPSYREFQREFGPKGLVVIGIHTPELPREKDIDRLQKKLDEAELAHPILVDNNSTNWKRWNNNWWPAVYLIDKKGIARYGWYGELKWQGAKGDEHFRKRITQLLAEH